MKKEKDDAVGRYWVFVKEPCNECGGDFRFHSAKAQLEDAEREAESLETELKRLYLHPKAVIVDITTGDGLDELTLD
jgi:hypothetical protein